MLISGVVLLTHKKPEPATSKVKSTAPRRRRRKGVKGVPGQLNEDGDMDADVEEARGPEGEVLWAVGDVSDEDDDDEGLDDDVDHHQHPIHNQVSSVKGHAQPSISFDARGAVNEHTGLVARGEDGDADEDEEDDGWVKQKRNVGDANDDRRRRRSMDPFRDVDDDAHELGQFSGPPKR